MEAGEEDPEPEAAIQDADGAHENDERLKNNCNPFTLKELYLDGCDFIVDESFDCLLMS